MPFPNLVRPDEPIVPAGLLIVILGPPDCGKSLTAQTCWPRPTTEDPNPEIVTYASDSGIYRAAMHRNVQKVYMQRWEESQIDQTTIEEFREENFRRVVLDTGGAILSNMQEFLGRRNPKLVAGGSFTPKGYGELAKKWAAFLYRFKYSWQMDTVMTGHIREVPVKEEIHERIDMPGQATINESYKEADLIGRIHRITKTGADGQEIVTRRISFSGNDQAFRKDPLNFGMMDVPNLADPDNYHWLSDVIDDLRSGILERQGQQVEGDQIVSDLYQLVDAQTAPNEDIATVASDAISQLIGIRATNKQVAPLLNKMSISGYAYDPKTRTFSVSDAAPVAEPTLVPEEMEA